MLRLNLFAQQVVMKSRLRSVEGLWTYVYIFPNVSDTCIMYTLAVEVLKCINVRWPSRWGFSTVFSEIMSKSLIACIFAAAVEKIARSIPLSFMFSVRFYGSKGTQDSISSPRNQRAFQVICECERHCFAVGLWFSAKYP